MVEGETKIIIIIIIISLKKYKNVAVSNKGFWDFVRREGGFMGDSVCADV
jgi:hypothetical protein